MNDNKLTEKEYWDNYWESIDLPIEVKKGKDNFLLNEELKIFEKFLPKKKLSILEIGGAPGGYLAYMHKQFGYEIHCLDYSEIGCEKTEENFKLLNIPGKVHNLDIFSEKVDLPLFDIVFSMGVIEHFEDVNPIIQKHLDLLKGGGILLLGLPNFSGVNQLFLRRLAPNLLSQHNLKTMDIRNWHKFENKFGLETISRRYIGGFEPMTFMIREKKSLINNLLFLKAKALNRIFHKNFSFLRKYNSRYFSAYIIGIYRKPV